MTESDNIEDEDSMVSRRDVLRLGAASATLAGTTGTASASPTRYLPDALSPEIKSDYGLFGHNLNDLVITYDGFPSFIVAIRDKSDYSTLKSWADERLGRTIRKEISSTEYVVSAPKTDVLPRAASIFQSSSSLADLDYVGSISYNVSMGTDPVDSIIDKTSFSKPVGHQIAKGSLPTDGIAFDSNSKSGTLDDVKPVVGADSISGGGGGVKLAVLDTGCNIDGGRLYNSVIAAKNFLTGETGTDAVADGNYHGSWCCSSIAASNGSHPTGVAPDVDLIVGKVLSDDGGGETADIIEGLRWAVETQNADLVSMSLGSPVYTEALAREIRKQSKDAVLVIAVGNSRQGPRWVSSPADTDTNLISVSATDISNPDSAGVAYFSQVGEDAGIADGSMGQTIGANPTISAPGIKIEVPIIDETGTIIGHRLTGTSMATPIVAGCLATAKSNGVDVNPQSAAGLLEDHSRPIPQAGETEAGNGMIALDYLIDGTTPDKSQSESRKTSARSRDIANRSLSGGMFDRLFTPES